MINPLRRLLYELFVLPPLRGIQSVIDLGASAIHHLHPAARSRRRRILRWNNDDYLANRGHLLLILAVTLMFQAAPVHAQGTPPYFPEGTSERGSDQPQPQDRNSAAKMPPETSAPVHAKLTTTEVQQQIQNKLDDEPLLKGGSVLATVDDETVVLSGSVENDSQRNAAVWIAKSHGGNRRIVDKITLADVEWQRHAAADPHN